MKLPTRQECLNLFKEYLVPTCIYRHCRKTSVAGVALAEALQSKGVPVDVRLVEIGALLHDMMKLYTVENLKPKPEIGYYGPTTEAQSLWMTLRPQFKGLHETIILSRVLEPRYYDFAQFVSRIGSTGNPTYFEGPIELKIIHYADWRIENDYIVPFSKRLEYLGEAYRDKWQKHGPDWWQNTIEKEQALEDELLTPLSISSEKFANMIIRHVSTQQKTPDELEQDIQYAVDVMGNGGIIVYPAKNGYIIGANPFDEWAINKVFQMKRRPINQFLPCIVSDITMVEKYISLTEEEKLITQALMPGPFLLVGQKSPEFPDLLTQEGFTFTIPRTDIARGLLNQYKQPIVATSCNISGKQISLRTDAIDPYILNYVDIIFDTGELPYQPDYTVVKFLQKGVNIKRTGLVDAHDVQNILNANKLSESALSAKDRVFFLESLLSNMTLDSRIKELWVRNRYSPQSSDLDIVVVTNSHFRDELYEVERRLFSQTSSKTIVPTGTFWERKFKLESNLELMMRYITPEEGVYLDKKDYRLLWASNIIGEQKTPIKQ